MARTWVLVAAILGSSMSFIDGSAVNVALPVIQRELHASAPAMQWVIEGYALFLSALLLPGGALGDVLGRRRMFVLGIALFAAASLGCAIASSVELLIAARCIQGIGGALMMPESLALISANYEGEERGRAIGLWSAFASLTAAGGPVLGGVLAQSASWRWVFLINLPIAVAVVVICRLFVAESRDESASRAVDYIGGTLATLGLGGLVYGLIRLEETHTDIVGIVAALTGLAVIGVFLWWERRTPSPMMPLQLFASPAFAATNLYTLFLYAALGGSLYFLPFALVDAQRYTPAAAGAAFLPFVALQVIFARWSGGLTARIGARAPLVIGALFAGCGFLAFAIPGLGGSYWTTYFPAAVLLGIGGAFFVAPLTTAVFDAVETHYAGVASGVNNAVARTAGLIAVAAFGIALVGAFNHSFDRRLDGATLAPQTAKVIREERSLLSGGSVPPDVAPQDRERVEAAIRGGILSGFRAVMVISTVVCWLAAFLALRYVPGRRRAA